MFTSSSSTALLLAFVTFGKPLFAWDLTFPGNLTAQRILEKYSVSGALQIRTLDELKEAENLPELPTLFTLNDLPHISKEEFWTENADLTVRLDYTTKISIYGPQSSDDDFVARIRLSDFSDEFYISDKMVFDKMESNMLHFYDRLGLKRYFSAFPSLPIHNPTLSLGCAGSGLSFHSHGASVSLQLGGYKLWMLFDPTADVRFYSEIGILSSLEIFHLFEHGDLPEAFKPIIFVQKIGELLYLPPLWHHLTLNIGDSLSLATPSADADSHLTSQNSLIFNHMTLCKTRLISFAKYLLEHDNAYDDLHDFKQLYKKCVKQFPFHMGLYQIMSNYLLNLGKVKKSKKRLRTAQKRLEKFQKQMDPSQIIVHYTFLASSWAELQEDCVEALEMYDIALGRDPFHFGALFGTMQCMINIGQEEAIAEVWQLLDHIYPESTKRLNDIFLQEQSESITHDEL